MDRIYLDHAATTPLDPRVEEAMAPFWSGTFGNPSSLHSFGQAARSAIEEARAKVADLLGAARDEIFFTSGGTEANNLAVFGTVRAARPIRSSSGSPGGSGGHLITTAIEHHSVLDPFRRLEGEGFRATYLPVTEAGIVDPGALAAALTPETVLVSVMHANNEIGTIQPIAEISRVLREKGVLFHVDAVQSAPHLPVRVNELGADLLTLSSHKLYGPKGAGALYARRGVSLRAILHGGSQEKGVRPGTENLPAIVGFGAAAELILAERDRESARLVPLRDRLALLLARIPGGRLNGDPIRRLPNNVNVLFDGVDGETLAIRLDLEGVACSTGSACASRSVEPSHVIRALGRSREEARSAVRFTLGRFSTPEAVERAAGIVARIVERIRRISPDARVA